MKINGFNPLTTGNTVSVEALNLRDGQKIIGRVISVSTDEALLEMAGHTFRATIEGNPEVEPGAVLKFLVNHDQQGRVLLKIISNDEQTNNPGNPDAVGREVPAQKAIIAALTKEGLPVNEETIGNFIKLLQSFEAKYQQALPPQVLAFIAAQKWPVNSETIITAWIYQDTELRNLLWNLLRQAGSSQSGAKLLARLMLSMSAKPEELQARLGALLRQIATAVRYQDQNVNGSSLQPRNGPTPAQGHGLGRPLLTGHEQLEPGQVFREPAAKSGSETGLRQRGDQSQNKEVKTTSTQVSDKGVPSLAFKASLLNEIKQLASKLTSSLGAKDLSEKIEALLERNLALNKAAFQDANLNGNYNLIPLLVNDSQNILHEVLVKWREEPGDGKQGQSQQILQMNIPTENLGEIHLYLRTGGNGSQITFKVENDSVRKYLLRNLIELKESLNRKDVLINVALEPKEKSADPFSGVDLWI